jgi:CTP synthase (UTP-ammonia lyase)
MGSGVIPDYIFCRSEEMITEKTKNKISMYTNLEPDRIIDDSDLATIYELPLHLMKQNFDKLLIRDLGLEKEA